MHENKKTLRRRSPNMGNQVREVTHAHINCSGESVVRFLSYCSIHSPEIAVKYTNPLLECASILNGTIDLFMTGQCNAGDKFSRAARKREAYRIKANVKCVANLYCDTLGTSLGPVKLCSSSPDRTIYHPIRPCAKLGRYSLLHSTVYYLQQGRYQILFCRQNYQNSQFLLEDLKKIYFRDHLITCTNQQVTDVPIQLFSTDLNFRTIVNNYFITCAIRSAPMIETRRTMFGLNLFWQQKKTAGIPNASPIQRPHVR